MSFVQDLADIRGRVNGMAGDLQDDIPGLKTTLGSGTIGIDLGDHYAFAARARHINGQVSVTVLAGTQPDWMLRLRGKGLPHFGGGFRGDLYVRLQIPVPERLSDRQRRLFEQPKASGTQRT